MTVCRLNYAAIAKTASMLSGLSLEDVLGIEEVDPQFEVAAAVCSSGEPGAAASVFLAALSAYRLRCSGEEYWERFAKHFAGGGHAADPVERVSRFLLGDPCSSYLRETKIGRVKRFSDHSDTIEGLARSCEFEKLWRLASRVLGADPASKTVVFAVKMVYYCGRATGACSGPLPAEIPIPLDSRVARATLALGLVSAESADEVMRKCGREAVEAWRAVGEATGIPPIHLDVLLWALRNPATFSKALSRTDRRQAREVLVKLWSTIRERAR